MYLGKSIDSTHGVLVGGRVLGLTKRAAQLLEFQKLDKPPLLQHHAREFNNVTRVRYSQPVRRKTTFVISRARERYKIEHIIIIIYNV